MTRSRQRQLFVVELADWSRPFHANVVVVVVVVVVAAAVVADVVSMVVVGVWNRICKFEKTLD